MAKNTKVYEKFDGSKTYDAGTCFQNAEKYGGNGTQLLVKLDDSKWLLKMEKTTSIIPADHEILQNLTGIWTKRNWITCWQTTPEGEDGYVVSFYQHNPKIAVENLTYEGKEFKGEYQEGTDPVLDLLRTIPIGTRSSSLTKKSITDMTPAEIKAYLASIDDDEE